MVAVLGFAIFLASVWTARNEAALVTDVALYTARFVKVAGCFAIAYLFRNHMPSVKNLVGIGAGFIAVHVVFYCMECHTEAEGSVPDGWLTYAEGQEALQAGRAA